MYSVDFQFAQRKGLKFYQTRSSAIILFDTLPAYCISKVVVMKSEEIIYQKVYVSPQPPPKISYKDNWMCDLDSDVAGSSKDTQRIQPKPNTRLSSTGRPVLVDQKEDHEIYFRVPGLSHAVVRRSRTFPSSRACEKIENHPHREALQADLQQNNVYNP